MCYLSVCSLNAFSNRVIVWARLLSALPERVFWACVAWARYLSASFERVLPERVAWACVDMSLYSLIFDPNGPPYGTGFSIVIIIALFSYFTALVLYWKWKKSWSIISYTVLITYGLVPHWYWPSSSNYLCAYTYTYMHLQYSCTILFGKFAILAYYNVLNVWMLMALQRLVQCICTTSRSLPCPHS